MAWVNEIVEGHAPSRSSFGSARPYRDLRDRNSTFGPSGTTALYGLSDE